MAGLLGELNTLVDSGSGGDAVEMKQLKGAETQGDPDFRFELRIGVFEKSLKLMVQANLPAQYAENQCGAKVAVGR